MQWPEVAELRDITITPLMPGNSKTRLALRADPPSPALGHMRYESNDSVVKILPASPAESAAAIVVDEPVIYGGLLFRHFGHALSESIHRLWPRFALEELRAAKIAFNPVNSARVMPYVIEALNLHGIPRRDVIRIEEPMRFRRLFVGPQARRMAGPTIIPGYQGMLDGPLEQRLPPPGGGRRIYLSRLHHQHTGSFYGESLVERKLAEQGFEIVYPEQHTLTELVIMLRASALAVFAEGSAIHALELCGSATPSVFVIGRRSRSVERFTPLLSEICRNWMVSDRLLLNAGMSLDGKKHSGVLDLPRLLADLWSFGGLEGEPATDRSDLIASLVRDLEQHIEDARNERTGDYNERADELRLAVRESVGAWADGP